MFKVLRVSFWQWSLIWKNDIGLQKIWMLEVLSSEHPFKSVTVSVKSYTPQVSNKKSTSSVDGSVPFW